MSSFFVIIFKSSLFRCNIRLEIKIIDLFKLKFPTKCDYISFSRNFDKIRLYLFCRLFDQDEDGRLTEDELRRVMVSIGEFSLKEEEFQELLKVELKIRKKLRIEGGRSYFSDQIEYRQLDLIRTMGSTENYKLGTVIMSRGKHI